MERRSLFKRLFGKDENVSFGTEMQLLSSYNATFTNWNGANYNNITVRACIDAIARNGAKLNPRYIRSKDGNFKVLETTLARLISERPNEYMNAFDFYYKVISQLQANSNSIVWIERDLQGNAKALYPINYSQIKFKESDGSVWCEFIFVNGKKYQALYDDVIHLRRHFHDNDILGSSPSILNTTIQAQTTILESIINGIKTTASLRGILKTIKSMLKPEDVKKVRDDFIADFVTTNSSGIAGLDATTDFIPVKLEPIIASADQMGIVNGLLYNHFGVNEKILQSNYTSDEWNAFYESTIEPIAVQMSLEFTNKIFTPAQRVRGNKIMFESNRLQYATVKEKTETVKNMGNYMTINEIREIFNLPPREDGDKILQSLNYVDQGIANNYQMGADNE